MTPGAINDQRKVSLGSGEARRKLDRAAEEVFRIRHPSKASGKLGHHSDCGDVERIGAKLFAKQPLSNIQLVCRQCRAALKQGTGKQAGFQRRIGTDSHAPTVPVG